MNIIRNFIWRALKCSASCENYSHLLWIVFTTSALWILWLVANSIQRAVRISLRARQLKLRIQFTEVVNSIHNLQSTSVLVSWSCEWYSQSWSSSDLVNTIFLLNMSHLYKRSWLIFNRSSWLIFNSWSSSDVVNTLHNFSWRALRCSSKLWILFRTSAEEHWSALRSCE